MPRGDGTGPAGLGPMTGRGLGYCAGYPVPGYMNYPAYGRGLAWRRGFGRGYGRGFGRRFGYVSVVPAVPYYHPPYNPGVTKKEEIEYLKDTARALEDELKAIKERLNELKDDQD
ncbi:MAG: hypothetical protein PWR10_1613 [Halanaerobiales bacterium]|nr:hypothetical protein [Halanaerobiales bacterium]